MVFPLERTVAVNWVYQFSIFSCMVMVLSVPYSAVIIAHEKTSAFAYISILDVTIKLSIANIITICEFDRLKLYALLIFFVQLIIRMTYGIYCNAHFVEVFFN